MILNKYSLNGKMHPQFNFETLFIKFQEEFLKFAFFQKLVLKLKNMIYYFTYVAYFLRYRTCCFRKLTNVSKKKGLTLLKEENPSELNFFYFRKALINFFFPYSLSCLIDKASASKAGDCWYESHQRKSI